MFVPCGDAGLERERICEDLLLLVFREWQSIESAIVDGNELVLQAGDFSIVAENDLLSGFENFLLEFTRP